LPEIRIKVYTNIQPIRELPPLILISGKAEEKRAQELLKEPGVAGLVAKPFAINRLLDKIRGSVSGVQDAQP
jgi:DNA-binding response OmpR family regulator